MGKKEETEVETEVGEGVKKNPKQRWSYLFGILFIDLVQAWLSWSEPRTVNT